MRSPRLTATLPPAALRRSLALLALGLGACGGGSGTSGGSGALVETWEQIGPDGGFITAFAFHPVTPGEVWVSADDGGGVYRSVDSGASWTQVASMPPSTSTHAFVIDPTNTAWMYSPSHFGRGFFKSTDAGASWTQAGAGLPVDVSSQAALEARRFYDLAVDPSAPSTLWAALADGLYRSTNFGDDFTKLDPSLVSGGKEADLDARVVLVSDGTGVAAGETFVGTAQGGVYHTDDGGLSWDEIQAPISALGPAVSGLSLTDNALYVAFWQGTVARTTTFASPLVIRNLGGIPCGGGCSFNSLIWTKLATASGASAAADVVYAGTVNPGTATFGLFASADGGATWTDRNTGLDGYSCQALALDPGDAQHLYYGAMGGGIFESTDGGATWTPRSTSVKSTVSFAVAEDPADADHLLSAGSVGLGDGTGGFYETTDGGSSWTRVTSLPNGVHALHVSSLDSDVVLAGTWSDGIHRSTNGTAGPWTQVMANSITPSRFAEDAVDPLRLYACAHGLTFFQPGFQSDADNGIYTSDDGGLTWTQPVSGSGGYFAVPHPTNTLEALAVGEDVYATTDAFATTSSLGLKAFAPGDVFVSAAYDPADPSTVIVGSISARLYVTTSYDPTGAGTTWQELANPAADVWIRKLSIDADGWFATCWIGDVYSTPSSTEGVMFSDDEGLTWRFLDQGIGLNRLVWEHFPSVHDPRVFYVGMWDGGPLRLTLSPN